MHSGDSKAFISFVDIWKKNAKNISCKYLKKCNIKVSCIEKIIFFKFLFIFSDV